MKDLHLVLVFIVSLTHIIILRSLSRVFGAQILGELNTVSIVILAMLVVFRDKSFLAV